MEFENAPFYDGGTFPEEVQYFDNLVNQLGFPHIKLASLEWNIAPGPWQTDPNHTKFRTALMQSEMQMQFVQAGVEVAALWSTQWPNTPDAEDRFLTDSDNGYVANPTAKVFELYKNTLNGTLLNSSTTNTEIMSATTAMGHGGHVLSLEGLERARSSSRGDRVPRARFVETCRMPPGAGGATSGRTECRYWTG